MHLKDAVLKNNLLKKFSRICCLLFNYQGSLLFVLESARLLYHVEFCLSRTFFIFFILSNDLFFFSNSFIISYQVCLVKNFLNFIFHRFKRCCCFLRISLLIISFLFQVVNTFLQVFSTFSFFFFHHHSSRNPIHMIYSFEKRRRRDLNPRAAINDLLPFQGSPFGQLGYFSKMSVI